MTAQLLTNELSTLIQESKRKNTELRNAAEKSLNELKALPRTSEAQIAADLKYRPAFVKPFVIACATRNPKFAGSAVICLQRLIVAQALSVETLAEVLEALKCCSNLALDIQLKVLQAIPSLLQNFSLNLTGQLLDTTFQICFLLYASKTSVVSNTAAAALQQLVNSTFEKAGAPGKDGKSPLEIIIGDGQSSTEASIGDGNVTISGPRSDAYNVLDDICLLTEGQRPKRFIGASLSQNFGLELLESIIANHGDTVTEHPEQIHVIRVQLMPLIIKILSEKASFSLSVRTMRVLQLILSRLLFALASECEMALSLLNHMLDPDAAVLWKRVLCLETFRSLHLEPALVRAMYSHYDETDGKRNIIRDHLGYLVRLASEKPNVIGLGQHSSVPAAQTDDSGEQAAMQAGGFIGTIGASVNTVDINTPGISNRWSTIRTPCIEMLDKNEPPPLPATYIYSLALTCVTTFSEGLARFLLPFTVPAETKSKRRHTRTERHGDSIEPERYSQDKSSAGQHLQSRRIPTNPLNLREHVLYSQISTSSHMVDQCWPALLAASSTFLNASMDSEHYHSLIRSFQKFTQIAGLLDLRTPRDAFLTTLGKHAVPVTPKSPKNPSSSSYPVQNDSRDGKKPEDESIATGSEASAKEKSYESSPPTINTRNLLCLRALLNLGIALGPFLQRSWSIILETLQQVDLVINSAGSHHANPSSLARRKSDFTPGNEDTDGGSDLSLEITAAETAASRMFENTNELPSNAFLDFLQCICVLFRHDTPEPPVDPSPDGMLSPGTAGRKHQKLRSVSGASVGMSAEDRESIFMLEKLHQVIENNTSRLLGADTQESGWELLLNQLKNLLSSQATPAEVRLRAADTLNEMAMLAAINPKFNDPRLIDSVRTRSFNALFKEIESVQNSQSSNSRTALQCEMEIHAKALDTTRSILEQCGDSLKEGWSSVFAIVNSIYGFKHVPEGFQLSKHSVSARLVRSSFGSLQLICSDFLTSVPSSSLLQLLDTLSLFSIQDQDLNISLTAASLFRNISDFLLRDVTQINLSHWSSDDTFDEQIIRKQASELSGNLNPGLWLYLLSKLVQLSVDSRLEVRHSTLRTLFGIFEMCGEQINATSAIVCFKHVLLRSLSANELEYASVREAHSEMDNLESWNQTAGILVDGISHILSQWLDSQMHACNYADMLNDLMIHLEKCLARQSLFVSKVTFAGLTMILSEIEKPAVVGEAPLKRSWELWHENNPASHTPESGRNADNQDALIAYIECLSQLLRLTKDNFTQDQIMNTLCQLQRSVKESSTSVYNSDVDQMTAVQKATVETLKRIPTRQPQAAFSLLDCITFLVTLAYERYGEYTKGSQTYVALSKAAMTLLESFVSHHIQDPDINSVEVVSKAIIALTKPINLKYQYFPPGKAPSPWRKATSTAVTVLKNSKQSGLLSGVQNLHKRGIEGETVTNRLVAVDEVRTIMPVTGLKDSLWEAIVELSNGILDADCDACDDVTVINQDQEADIGAFTEVRAMIIPTLGSSFVSETTLKAYAESIFKHSLIHEPHPDDLGHPNQELLEGLKNYHVGRVHDLHPSPRSRLCYLLLDYMFDLTSVDKGSSDEQINLSKATIPYLILRIGVTLKAYIHDQPLRGLIPQPWSQKEEMLFLLRKLLGSKPIAETGSNGSVWRHEKYLHTLHPLLMRALRVAKRDEEIENVLTEALEVLYYDIDV